MSKRTEAAKRYTKMRQAGAPSVVTADEAFRMTNGEVGTKGDHSTPVNLSTVAMAPAARAFSDGHRLVVRDRDIARH